MISTIPIMKILSKSKSKPTDVWCLDPLREHLIKFDRLDLCSQIKAIPIEDVVAMLEDLDLQIDESAAYNREYAKIQRLIRDRIDKLKGEEDGNK